MRTGSPAARVVKVSSSSHHAAEGRMTSRSVVSFRKCLHHQELRRIQTWETCLDGSVAPRFSPKIQRPSPAGGQPLTISAIFSPVFPGRLSTPRSGELFADLGRIPSVAADMLGRPPYRRRPDVVLPPHGIDAAPLVSHVPQELLRLARVMTFRLPDTCSVMPIV